MRILLGTSLLAALSCTACASTPSEPSNGSTESPATECRAEAARQYIGQKADAQVVEAAKAASKANLVRVAGPDDAVTMDLRPDRLDIRVDAGRTITSINCG